MIEEIELNDLTPLSQCSGTYLLSCEIWVHILPYLKITELLKISRVAKGLQDIVLQELKRKKIGTIIPEEDYGFLLLEELGIATDYLDPNLRDLNLLDFFKAIAPLLNPSKHIFSNFLDFLKNPRRYFMDLGKFIAFIKVLALLKDKVALQVFLTKKVEFTKQLVRYRTSRCYGNEYLPHFSLLRFVMEHSSDNDFTIFTTLYKLVSYLPVIATFGNLRRSPSEFWDEERHEYIGFLFSAMKRKDLDLVDFLTRCEINVLNKHDIWEKYNIWFNSKRNESQHDQISPEIIRMLQFLFVKERYDFMEKLCDLLFKKHQKVYTALSNTCRNTEHNEYKELFLWFSDKLKLNQAPQEPLSSYEVLTR